MQNLRYFVYLLFFIAAVSCNSQKNKFNIAYTISEKDLIPEGITYSKQNNSFYVSSILKEKIIQVDAKTGTVKDFIEAGKYPSRFLGLLLDDANGHLWACGNKTQDNKRYSAIFKFDLKSSELIKKYEISDEKSHTLNDLAIDDVGNIYFTDTDHQSIYKIAREADTATLFFDDKQIIHPNGITISPDSKRLYIASNDHGIKILDIANKTILNPDKNFEESKGLDGIKFYKNSIIGIQNEVARSCDVKIARYPLSPDGKEISGINIIDQNHPLFEIPTTFVIVNNQLFCIANSQMGNINWQNYSIRNYRALNDIFILKYDLKR